MKILGFALSAVIGAVEERINIDFDKKDIIINVKPETVATILDGITARMERDPFIKLAKRYIR